MTLRGCVILLFISLCGIVNAEDVAVTSPASTPELSTSQISTVTPIDLTGSQSSATSHPTSSHASVTTEATPYHSTTSLTTEATTTPQHNATTHTTDATTTPQHNVTTHTTDATTTPQHNVTNHTTEVPTTPQHNITNSTTGAPTTAHSNATTAPTPPPTNPPIPKPTIGNYSVRLEGNSSACLLANLGLQFSFSIGNDSRQTINVNPNVTKASGTCGSDGNDSSLVLTSDKITVQFVFTNVSDKFHLHAFMLSIDIGNGSFFNQSNTNLSLWEASVGSSYMCRKEQSYNVSDKLTLNTFDLQVQPFAVQKSMFSTAHECSMDDISLLIPIIVGAALAGLIFIVVIAYVIGRRRTYVGYQTL